MPDCDGIAVSLISQYDACTIPEYAPPASQDPFVETPKLFDPDQRLVTVYSPIYPTSQFWAAYQVSPEAEILAPYFYFKLFLDGRHIVSWGCGGHESFKGKTMFALFRGHTDGTGLSEALETRALYFGSTNDMAIANLRQDTIEVRVYRSKARKKSPPGLEHFKDTTAAVFSIHNKGAKEEFGRAVALFNTGPLMWGQPRRYYKYALLDPTDHPYVRFRYVLRSIKQLAELGIISPMNTNIGSTRGSEYGGPSYLRPFQSMSMQSIATSIASDTDIGRPLLFPLAGDYDKSPSPLRIPPMLSIRTDQKGAKGQYSIAEVAHRPSNPSVSTQVIVGSQIFESNILTHVSKTMSLSDINGINGKDLSSEDSDLSDKSHHAIIARGSTCDADIELFTNKYLRPTSASKPIIRRDKPSRESLLRACVSDLLASKRQNSAGSSMKVRATSEQQGRLSFKDSLEALRCSTTCTDAQLCFEPASSNDARSLDTSDELDPDDGVFPPEHETCPQGRTRERSVINLKIALRSALRRSQREKGQNKKLMHHLQI